MDPEILIFKQENRYLSFVIEKICFALGQPSMWVISQGVKSGTRLPMVGRRGGAPGEEAQRGGRAQPSCCQYMVRMLWSFSQGVRVKRIRQFARGGGWDGGGSVLGLWCGHLQRASTPTEGSAPPGWFCPFHLLLVCLSEGTASLNSRSSCLWPWSREQGHALEGKCQGWRCSVPWFALTNNF